MTLQRGNREGALRSGDSSDEGFELARVAAAEQRVRRSRGNASVDSRPSPSEGGAAPRVLLVDDNCLLVRSLARWLCRYGCTVATAFTGGGAAELSGPFDCGV